MKKIITSLLLVLCVSGVALAQRTEQQLLRNVIQTLPNSLEISYLIKDVGIKFRKNLLNPISHARSYHSDAKQALNLGVYSTDLGYINIYHDTPEAKSQAFLHLTAVKRMADSLRCTELFNFEVIQRLVTHSDDLDSLFKITNDIFAKLDNRFNEQKKPELSLLSLTGGWIESMYLTVSMDLEKPNKILTHEIVEQKLVLEQIEALLSFYESKPYVRQLINSLKKLRQAFAEIKTSRQVTKKRSDGTLIVEEKKAQIPKKTLQRIFKEITILRNQIIQPDK
ncbi:hypothetical protein [Microscilla marina]|uniref:Uncharacterized protein n=1 Tax=Microscilla marina ATCC 23134 TaxID=313606 RepID=A1ZRD7_MICM2|nr:hypothetical protein [Microscilla marina]EAY27027.1 hypothetical protein M23134_04715 [Microscilla marina ATCC 23134]